MFDFLSTKEQLKIRDDARELVKYENICILYQPAYSPELNPVEHFWEYIRKNYMHNYAWSSMAVLEKEIERILKLLAESAETIKSLVGFN